MKEYFFTKMTGAGNDFIVFDKKTYPYLTLSPELIQQLCDRHYGIGADGVMVIGADPIEGETYAMDYYNADGSTGSLCGNGSRCAAKFIAQRDEKFNFSLKSAGKLLGAQVNEKNVKIELEQPQKIKTHFKVKLSGSKGQMITAHFADTGSPHVVIDIANIEQIPGNAESGFRFINQVPVYELGREIRNLPEFVSGTNVNFIQKTNKTIYIRTYERGVENETLACGTGSVAAAIISSIIYSIDSPIELITAGGDTLKVSFSKNGNEFSNICLSGPAEVSFTGQVSF